MVINLSKCKPCFSCRGTGKAKDNKSVCSKCGGYGSIGLKIIQQNLRKTNKGN